MSWLESALSVFRLLISIWNYIRGEEAVKAEAAQAMAEQFQLIESKSGPIMSDILVRMGRASWVDWNQVTKADGPGAKG